MVNLNVLHSLIIKMPINNSETTRMMLYIDSSFTNEGHWEIASGLINGTINNKYKKILFREICPFVSIYIYSPYNKCFFTKAAKRFRIHTIGNRANRK